MTGITAYSTYLPVHRLARADIAAVLGSKAGGGTRVVAGHDEDTTTMAVAAARPIVRHRTPGSVWLATTRPAYYEKNNAALVHAALGLPDDVGAFDVGGALRSGPAAVLAALRSGGMAVLSDIRVGLPESAAESSEGDGAVALSFGDDGVIAEVLATAATTVEVLDRWRLPDADTVEVWDERFAVEAYGPAVKAAVEASLKQAGLTGVDHVAVASASARVTAAVRALTGSQPVALDKALGFTGAAHVGFAIADALDRAAAGETVLVLAVADGVDAIVLRATELLAEQRPAVSVLDEIGRGQPVSYGNYLTWRGTLRRQPPRRPDPQAPAAPPSLRDGAWKHHLVGSECTECGRVHLPPQRVCSGCGSVDATRPVSIADRSATVATFTIDRLAYSMAPPVVMAVVDIDGGGRFVVEVTDLVDGQIAIGDRLEPTFRRLATSEGIHNYFWKMRPVRSSDGE